VIVAGLHPTHVAIQRCCCAVLHALSRRSALLAAEVTAARGAQLICRAMLTFRGGSGAAVARLQATACAALAAALETPFALAQVQAAGGVALLTNTVADYASDSEQDAAVQLCGWRAILGMLEAPNAGSADSADDSQVARASQVLAASTVKGELLPLLWQSFRLHQARPVVQAACCEVLAFLLSEDAKRFHHGRADLLVVSDRAGGQLALQAIRALARHGSHLSVADPMCRAVDALCASDVTNFSLADYSGLEVLLKRTMGEHGANDEELRHVCADALHRCSQIVAYKHAQRR